MARTPKGPAPYGVRLLTVTHRIDPKTSGPLPLKLTLEINSYASALAFLRDVADCRIPITIQVTEVQLPMPQPPRRTS